MVVVHRARSLLEAVRRGNSRHRMARDADDPLGKPDGA
jgi:hypothetical protein